MGYRIIFLQHAVNDELSGKLQLAQMDVDEIHIEEAEGGLLVSSLELG